MVDFFLTPGFLKCGTDNAEHLDQYSVWTPAKFDIQEGQGGNPPHETDKRKQRRWSTFGHGLALGPPTGLAED